MADSPVPEIDAGIQADVGNGMPAVPNRSVPYAGNEFGQGADRVQGRAFNLLHHSKGFHHSVKSANSVKTDVSNKRQSPLWIALANL